MPKRRRSCPPWVYTLDADLPKLTVQNDKKIHLPRRTATQDNEVLRPARRGEKGCSNKGECCAVKDILSGPGVPLVVMIPYDLCILCLRKKMCSKWIQHTILQEPVLTSDLVQIWESVVDQEDGYLSEACIDRSKLCWNGFISPVAIGTVNEYMWMHDREKDEWYIDQSLLLFRKAPL